MSLELFLTEPYFQRVAVTALLIGATAAAMGVFLVQRGMALFGDGIAHMSFAGVALGFVAGWLPLATAAAVAILGAIAVQELQRRGITRSDAGLGLVYTTGLAIGVLLVSRRGSVPPDVDSYLFGNLLLAGAAEFRLALAIALTVAVAVLVLWRPLLLLSFGEEQGKVQGLPVRALQTTFTILTALTVVAAVRVVGVLLVSALLIVPAAAAGRLARSMREAVALAVLFALASVVVGIAVSATFQWPTGATIAVSAAAVFVATSLRR